MAKKKAGSRVKDREQIRKAWHALEDLTDKMEDEKFDSLYIYALRGIADAIFEGSTEVIS